MPDDVAEIARGLTGAARQVITECTPWDVCVGAGAYAAPD